ncbi:MAG: protease modulator HflC [Deltaproteobacteria bacterium]|nr:protease modulator HflC [Deltaproteobacteria bacterium]
MSSKAWIPLVLIAVLLFVAVTSLFVVDETEQVVITRFGQVVREPITEPGLGFKLSIFEKANKFPKNLQEWDGERGQIPTLDKTYLWVDTFARWRIVDPKAFLQTAGRVETGKKRLDEIIDPAVRDAITAHPLIETVRKSNRQLDTYEISGADVPDQTPLGEVKVGRRQITEKIRKAAAEKLKDFGIELVDVKIKRVNYIDTVRRSVYDRMIAERKQIAEKFRSEGQGEARSIRGEKEKELKRIQSEAYRTAQEIMGKADAEAVKIYAQAFSSDPEFYSFVRTLELYKESMGKDSEVILSTDSEFLRYLKDSSRAK